VGYAAGHEPQVSTLASRTIRWGGALILLFLVYHIMHFTLGTVHTSFIEGNPYHNVATGFGNPLVVVFYELAMVAVGLHLYHGIWSSGRSLGVSTSSPRPLRRQLALALSAIVWAGFTAIPIAVYAGVIRP
jgi:succinate dehydrogenase / fumarate reductase cytochrome b subunit